MALRVGFIGVGGISRAHRAALGKMDDVAIAAVCDVDGGRARAAADEHGAAAYADWRAMLAKEPLDVLYICVPPGEHGEMERRAVERGLPMFIEKPLAIRWETAATIAREIADAGLTVSVGYHNRYSPAALRAKALVAEATLGSIVGAWAGTMPGTPWWPRRDGSGGQINDQATHMFDLVRFLGGSEPRRVWGLAFRGHMAGKVPGFDVDDATVSNLELANGVVASISTSCMLPVGYHVGVDLLTDRAVMRVEQHQVTIEDALEKSTYRNPPGFSPWGRATEVFMDAVRSGDASRIQSPYADALRTFALTCAVQASCDRRGAAVDLAEFS